MCSRPAASCSRARPTRSPGTKPCARPTWGTDVERFLETLIDGSATGSLYGALALALVLIYRSTGIVNFAQGEMAMFSTFGAWALTQAGLPLGVALVGALAASFVGGMVIERVIIRPVEREDPLTILI